jgi:hypothetical protein
MKLEAPMAYTVPAVGALDLYCKRNVLRGGKNFPTFRTEVVEW